jgi:hypothetical protein
LKRVYSERFQRSFDAIRYVVSVQGEPMGVYLRRLGVAYRSFTYRLSRSSGNNSISKDVMLDQREAVAAHIETGFAQAECGELIDGDTAVEMLRQRRAGRLKPQG